MKGEEYRQWAKWVIGKPCPKHPQNKVKDGKYGLWCGAKNDWGTYCDCGSPSEAELTLMRKEIYEK